MPRAIRSNRLFSFTTGLVPAVSSAPINRPGFVKALKIFCANCSTVSRSVLKKRAIGFRVAFPVSKLGSLGSAGDTFSPVGLPLTLCV